MAKDVEEKTLIVNLPVGLHADLKAKAAKDRTSIKAIVQKLLTELLYGGKKKKKKLPSDMDQTEKWEYVLERLESLNNYIKEECPFPISKKVPRELSGSLSKEQKRL